MASDLNSKCRTCLCESNSYHQLCGYVEEKYKILEMLNCVVPQIDVKTTSQFSTLVCNNCVEQLLIGYKFQQLCIETHNRLHDLLEIRLFETRTQLEKMKDPLTAESNQTLKEEIHNVCLDFYMRKDVIGDGRQLPNNRFLDDSDTSNEKLSTLKERMPAENHRKNNFVCSEREQKFNSSNKLKQRRGRQDKKANGLDSDGSATTAAKQEMELKQQIIHTASENPGGNAEYDGPKTGDETNEFVGIERVEKKNKRKYTRAQRLKKHKLDHSANLLKSHLVIPSSEAKETSESRAEEPFECPYCLRRFERQAALSSHRQSHVTSGINYPCTLCQRSFMSLKTLVEHITSTHPEAEKFKCDQCDKTFVFHAYLVEHLNRHKGNKNVVCLICEKEFAYRKTLKEHMRTHSDENPYLCPECGKTFRSTSNLRQHMERHTVLKKYQCPECPSRFKCKSYLVKHAITHSNAKPHVCDICGSRFTRTTSLQKHKLLHSGERPFKCEQCNMTFAVIYHLRRHMRTHTGEKPYKCNYCDRAYAESGDLTKHLRTHVGENTYMCDQCPMAFKYQAELRQHQSQHYKMAQKPLEKPHTQDQTNCTST